VKVAIHQPQYFPWPAYVHKVMSADIFVYLDVVGFSKNGLQNRNKINTAQGPKWLTVPVAQHLGTRILEVEIADRRITHKHWKTLANSYARTPGFERWRDELADLFSAERTLLADLTIASTEWMLNKLEINTRRIRASEIAGRRGQASELVASICESLGATTYLTGIGALAYMNQTDFTKIGCAIAVQDWKSITYEQIRAAQGFTPDLSTLDLLLNCPDDAAALIQAGGSWTAL
jgi:hypothetical protein